MFHGFYCLLGATINESARNFRKLVHLHLGRIGCTLTHMDEYHAPILPGNIVYPATAHHPASEQAVIQHLLRCSEAMVARCLLRR
jgi:hypothetical protein